MKKKKIYTSFSLGLVVLIFLCFKNLIPKKKMIQPELSLQGIHEAAQVFDQSILNTSFSSEQPLLENQKNHRGTLIKNYQTVGHQYTQLRGSIHKHELRNQLLDQMLKDPNMIQLAQKVLTDLNWTLKTFQKTQAEARIVAIALLKRQAALGQFENLESQIQKVATELSKSQKNWKKGRDQDLVDLLGAWISLQGIQGILEHPHEFFEKMHYQRSLRKPFYEAFRLYAKSNPEENWEDLLEKHL